jgi:hypothetical protein
MAAINLRERDELHGKLFDVRCPMLWLHGDADVVYSVRNAQKDIKMFVNAKSADLGDCRMGSTSSALPILRLQMRL